MIINFEGKRYITEATEGGCRDCDLLLQCSMIKLSNRGRCLCKPFISKICLKKL